MYANVPSPARAMELPTYSASPPSPAGCRTRLQLPPEYARAIFNVYIAGLGLGHRRQRISLPSMISPPQICESVLPASVGPGLVLIDLNYNGLGFISYGFGMGKSSAEIKNNRQSLSG
jgi:hypothetical protein